MDMAVRQRSTQEKACRQEFGKEEDNWAESWRVESKAEGKLKWDTAADGKREAAKNHQKVVHRRLVREAVDAALALEEAAASLH